MGPLHPPQVPPISGGPGNSRAGGLFTIAYAFFYASFALAFILQFLFFNEHTSASLIPTPSEHYSVTAATLLHELSPHSYISPHLPVSPHIPPYLPIDHPRSPEITLDHPRSPEITQRRTRRTA